MLALTLTVATLSAALVPVGALGMPSEGEPPLADAGLDQRVAVDTTVTLDATGSRDPDGTIVSYRWRVERPDGRTTTTAPPNRGRTTLTVTQPGRYEVTVTVTDDDGNSASDTLYVVVDGTPAPTTTPVSTPERPVTTPSSEPTETRTPVPTVSSTTTASGPPDVPSASTVASTGPPTGPTGPTVSITGGPEATPPTGPTCAETFGPGCIPEITSDCSTTLARECIRTVRISGPDTLDEGETGTYTAVTNGFDGDVSFRWQAGEVSRSVERSFSPGEHTVVVTATDGESTFIAEKTVYVGRNAPPKVSIADPGDLSPGESVVLSLDELTDPDGTVTSVSWSGGSPVSAVRGVEHVRSVTVPDGDGTKRVEVTAVDDDGASATDRINLLSSSEIIQNKRQISSTRVAQCTFYEFAARETGQPIRCWNKDTGEVIYDRDPNEGPKNVFDPHSHPNYDVEWYRVGISDDDSITPGAARARRVPGPDEPIQHENTARADNVPPTNVSVTEISNSAQSEPGFEPYTKNGTTVQTDVTGDGRVDLQDWQERFGDPSAKSAEDDRETVQEVKSDNRNRSETTTTEPEDEGLVDSVTDAFQAISDTVTSDDGPEDGGTDKSSSQKGDQSGKGVADSVTDTVSDITKAFANLGSEESDTESDGGTESNSNDDGGSSNSEDDSDSCSETMLGLPICF